MKKRGRSVLFTDAFYPLALTYWTHRSQIWKVMRSLYNLLERVFDRVNRDGGVCGQVTHSRYETEQYRYSLYMPVTVPSDGFFLSGDLSYIYADKTEKYAISHAHNGIIPSMRLLCPP